MALPLFIMPKGVAYPVKRSPIWATKTQTAISGATTTVQAQSYPRRRYELSFEFLRTSLAERQYVEGFYNSVGGAARAWLFHDVDDGAVTDEPFGTGDGVNKAFPLLRSVNTVAYFPEPVFAPATVEIKIGGSVSAGYTIGATGLITFSSPPAAGAALTWTGTYHWVCRFDDDNIDFSQFMSDLWSLGKLSFTTLKLRST
jgi:uncharacterized protein (TIGR02217 family)